MFKEKLPKDLQQVLSEENIEEKDCKVWYSDLHVKCDDVSQAIRIRKSGAWNSLAEVFQSKKPEDYQAIFVEIPLALLGENYYYQV